MEQKRSGIGLDWWTVVVGLASAALVLAGVPAISLVGARDEKVRRRNCSRLLPGVAVIFALAIGGKLLSDWLQAVIVINWVRSLASNVIIAIVVGMLVGNLVPLPKLLSPGIAAYEFFLKVGIVLMGARFLVTDVARLGGIGLAMVVVEILFSIAFVTLIARWFRLPEKLGSLLSIGVGICGVSAIIGAAPSIEAEKEETGYAIAVILVFGAAALVVYPPDRQAPFDVRQALRDLGRPCGGQHCRGGGHGRHLFEGRPRLHHVGKTLPQRPDGIRDPRIRRVLCAPRHGPGGDAQGPVPLAEVPQVRSGVPGAFGDLQHPVRRGARSGAHGHSCREDNRR